METSAPYINPTFITLAANEKRTTDTPGGGIICRSLGGESEIELKLHYGDGATEFVPFAVGEKFFFPHTKFTLRNPLAIPVDVQVYQVAGPDVYEDLRQRGELDIFGNVTTTGQPLTTDGGSISPLGGSLLDYTNAVSAGAQISLVTAAANTNGVIVRSAQLKSGAGATGEAFLYGTNPGNAQITWLAPHTSEQRVSPPLPRDVYLDPGRDLLLQEFTTGLTEANVTYDIL